MASRFFPLVALIALAACAQPSVAPPLPAGDQIGRPIEGQEVIPLATIRADPTSYFERTLLVEASVVRVCQSKGCWMEVEDEDHKTMVRWDTGCGGEFAFPQESVGRRILIQGSFYPKVISEEDAEHLEAEAGGEMEVEREGYEINASAVLVMNEKPKS